MSTSSPPPADWTPDSWRTRPLAQGVEYDDPQALARALAELAALPPLVTSWEIERLKGELAAAQRGERFVLQGGDCAESFAECRASVITNRLKVLLQMSVVLIQAGRRPVTRIGRFAGQYAKPRSRPTEARDGCELPSYFGDMINRPAFDPEARRADPRLLVAAYERAALTLNFVRSLSSSGFADLAHPENWDLSFLERDGLSAELRASYRELTRQLAESLQFMRAVGGPGLAELNRVEFFCSHEGLSLPYEAAHTTTVPRRAGYYDLTTHLPWIGERTRALDGAHVEFFRGIRNPIGVKLGPTTDPAGLPALLDRLDPAREPGRMVLITRLGADHVEAVLPGLIAAVQAADHPVLWICDPMHGNTEAVHGGIKTRRMEQVIAELERSFDVHRAAGSQLGGVHLELTGEDVTECLGAGLTEADLTRNYASLCDPRLNARQALELAFRLGTKLRADG